MTLHASRQSNSAAVGKALGCDHCGQEFHHLEQKKVGGGGVGHYIYRLNKHNGHNGHNGSVYTYIHIYIYILLLVDRYTPSAHY
jgi:hypothetical protein